MKITKAQVEKLATLAQLNIPAEKVAVLGKEMQRILTYVETISEVDTKNVEPTHQVTGFVNSFRIDEAVLSPEPLSKELKKSAPTVTQEYIVAPRVFKTEHKTKK